VPPHLNFPPSPDEMNLLGYSLGKKYREDGSLLPTLYYSKSHLKYIQIKRLFSNIFYSLLTILLKEKNLLNNKEVLHFGIYLLKYINFIYRCLQIFVCRPKDIRVTSH
jgi:hypothetical protein